jgi:hypothetical protein
MVASTWWQDFLSKDDAVGSRTEQTKLLKQILREALEGGGQEDHEADLQLRRRAAYQLTQMANRVWKSHADAGKKRSWAHAAQRMAAGGGAAVAAFTGGALAAGFHGTAAKVIGIVVAAIAILASTAAAIWPESEYQRNRGKSRQYEKLWWDIWDFATLELPTVNLAELPSKLEAFSEAKRAVGED